MLCRENNELLGHEPAAVREKMDTALEFQNAVEAAGMAQTAAPAVVSLIRSNKSATGLADWEFLLGFGLPYP